MSENPYFLPFASLAELAGMIELSLPPNGVTLGDVDEACAEARRAGYAAVCVRQQHVRQAAALLRGSMVRTCAVIGSPEGTMSFEQKMVEALLAVIFGAQRIDWVIDHTELNNNWVAALVGPDGIIFKERQAMIVMMEELPVANAPTIGVIIECCALNVGDERLAELVRYFSQQGEIGYINTSTGYGIPHAPHVPRGARAPDVRVIRSAFPTGSVTGVKATGRSIRTLADLLALYEAGTCDAHGTPLAQGDRRPMRFGISAAAARDIMTQARECGLR